MSTIRRRRSDNFAIIPNHVADDESLSFEARGVLVYLLAKPDDWQLRTRDLQNKGSMGRDKTLRIIGELKEAGYLIEKTRPKDKAGRFKGSDYEVRDVPFSPQSPESHPQSGFPDTGEPEAENPTPYKELTETNTNPPPSPSRANGSKAGGDFSVIWESWPEGDLPDSEAAAQHIFDKMPAKDREMATQVAKSFVVAMTRRDERPLMITYFKDRLFKEFEGMELTADGRFAIKPGTPEWEAWRSWAEQRGPKMLESFDALTEFYTLSRFPRASG